MAKYTGRRIVPKHAGEWNIRKEYEELQIVLDTESGNSYISNLPVPRGTALTDEKYWSLYSLYSEQIAEAEEHLTQTAGDIRTELSETESRINESLSSTENKVNTSLSETENRVTARVENAKSDLTAKVTPTHVVINLNHNSSLAEYKANIPDIVKTIKREYPDIIVILMSIDETGTYFPAKYPEYRASEITLGGLHSKNMSIYQYFCDELQDEANGIYVCSGHLIQPAVESYPTLDYVSADSIGRQSGRVLHMAYGRSQYGGPNWHPNNYAHCAWGYQLYALVKYTLAIQDMK